MVARLVVECRACKLALTRRKIVPGRGVLPAQILFIGEAPGKSEDLLGKAFIGPSGKILDAAIEKARLLTQRSEPPSFYITNTVVCRPADSLTGPNRQPTEEEVFACRGNIERILIQTNPGWVVILGKVAKEHYQKVHPGALILDHPAFIARKGGINSSEFRKFVRGLVGLFEEIKKAEEVSG